MDVFINMCSPLSPCALKSTTIPGDASWLAWSVERWPGSEAPAIPQGRPSLGQKSISVVLLPGLGHCAPRRHHKAVRDYDRGTGFDGDSERSPPHVGTTWPLSLEMRHVRLIKQVP